MTAPVVIHPEAGREIARARDWYDEISPELGDDFSRCILESLDLIADNPRLYADTGDGLRRAMVRRFPYHILYRTGRARIAVLTVCHSHADPRRVIEEASRRRRTAKAGPGA